VFSRPLSPSNLAAGKKKNFLLFEESFLSQRPGLNRRPAVYDTAALPTELRWLIQFSTYSTVRGISRLELPKQLRWLIQNDKLTEKIQSCYTELVRSQKEGI
jgi:hypothetical protein